MKLIDLVPFWFIKRNLRKQIRADAIPDRYGILTGFEIYGCPGYRFLGFDDNYCLGYQIDNELRSRRHWNKRHIASLEEENKLLDELIDRL